MKKPAHAIVLTRTVNASAQDVSGAWTNSESMERWLGKVSADVRVGGHYRFESKTEDGRTYIYTGEYLALEPGRRIGQSFLAGEPDPTAPNPYSNEFIEIQLRDPSLSQTEVING